MTAVTDYRQLRAGAATADITPRNSQFLFGYPHVERYSTGVHDPLLSSALFLTDGATQAFFIANDVIYVSKATASRARRRIAQATSVPEAHIMVTATHTHSGPVTIDLPSSEGDPAVPNMDTAYLALLEDGIVEAATRAWQTAEPAEVGLALADGAGVGTNRRDPSGPADPEVPVLMVRSAEDLRPVACMIVCSMHPTVLHEDSTLVSADFPGATRQQLQQREVGETCPVIYHTGPCGNQSPRHVTQENTFSEAERLGRILGQGIADAITTIDFRPNAVVECAQAFLDLPRRAFPSVKDAEANLADAGARLNELRRDEAASQSIRTAECDRFGAEEILTLARAAAEGRLDTAYASCLPAEIQTITIGPWTFVGWPGEVFVEYALAVKAQRPNTFIASLANGELHGYVVTQEAAAECGYEASNALFGPESGKQLIAATMDMLAQEPVA